MVARVGVSSHIDWSRIRMTAKISSFHTARNCSTASVAMPLAPIGKMMDRIIRKKPAPSIRAASMTSSGMPRKVRVRKNVANGTPGRHVDEDQPDVSPEAEPRQQQVDRDDEHRARG